MVLETLQITAEIMQSDPSQDSAPVQGSILFLFYQVQIRTLHAIAKLAILRESKNHNGVAITHFLNRPS